MLEFRSLQNAMNSSGDTAVRKDSGPWSRKTQCHNQKHLQKRLTVASAVSSRQTKHKPKNASALPKLYRGQPLNSFTFGNCVQKRQLNNSFNGVQITAVRTLQGSVTVNQIRKLCVADNL